MPQWLNPIGRIFYAAGLIGIGIQHWIFADFIPVMIPFWPSWIPGRAFWVYALGAALIGAGAAILFGIQARRVAAILGAAILVLVVIDDIPARLIANPGNLAAWTNSFKALTMGGGAWMVALSLSHAKSPLTQRLEALMPVGRFFLPITVIVFGIDHFIYTVFVASLVPSWIPGSYFWTYFAGVALIAAGVGIILKILERWAALLLGVMIFLWLIMLHIPRAIADPHTGKGNEWTSVCEALAFSGIAFLLAVRSAAH
ncbi:DoxX [Candidatus Sulfopaludibacter sp. SbA3]|nr:DoxX [Candidatus Sulfopaludibacter sp. SbA3]